MGMSAAIFSEQGRVQPVKFMLLKHVQWSKGCDEPRDPVVVAAYSLAVYNGEDMAVRRALSHMTDEYHVAKAMSAFLKAPKSDLQKDFVAKQGSKIDNELLTLGSLEEVRHVFARVVFDTVYPVSMSLEYKYSAR
ncbi:hypothetical protein POM88_043466 [Heracleum sosnowskyi]|uniref:Uncharacterized protein n=1 Tax=Heracleum sosnowskyi TaxID=360622 RepID=A0AAD8H3L3_9APIA|nr:hypothetical protein POM88_043466 [Heracleum sosnowskyi]